MDLVNFTKEIRNIFIKNIVLFLTLGAFSFTTLAATQIPQNRKVLKIHTYDNYAIIRYTPSYASIGSTERCTAENGATVHQETAVYIDLTNNKGKMMLMSTTAAAHGGAEIGFGTNGCFDDWGVPKVYRVELVL